MKTQRPKILGREFWLLSLPILLLGGIALLRESINSNPLRIQVDSIEQVKSTWEHPKGTSGADVTIRTKLSVVGIAALSNRNGWTWFEDVSLVAVKNGKVRYITNGWDPYSFINGMPIFAAGKGSSDQTSLKREWTLRLRDIPREWGDLELHGKVAYGPPGNGVTPRPAVITAVPPQPAQGVRPGNGVTPTTKSKIAYIERTGNGLIFPLKIPVQRPDK